ncbi:SpoIIE family protein phosphatase [Sediminitomix flava]|uniref:Serine phosphatase RsbU (Regulator of sigma subunit) n=1 Tax=Sediminitomix flava TaxID=379075 RepID=A0A315Z7L9_SEDFL|nr:SpoIIE family protein phosphatase [Sediminitomix flava]PWJ40232.1 serine phosphatase RsbU (regulator of sigma subunit) [Sediminitomix flava]
MTVKTFKWILITSLLLISNFSFSQTDYILELEEKLKLENTEDTIRVKDLSYLSFSLWQFAPEKGISYGLEAIELAKKLNFERGIAISYRAIATCYYGMGELEKATAYNLNCLEIAEELKDQNLILSTLTNLGNCYVSNKDTIKAIKYYKESANRSNENELSPMLLNNIGIIYTDLYKFDSALLYLNSGIRIARENKNTNELTLLLLNKSESLIKNNKLDLAESHLQESEPLLKQLNSSYYNAFFHNVKALLYEKTNRLKLAEDHYKKAIEIAQEFGFKEQELKFHDFLATLYERENKYNQAYHTLRTFIKLSDESFSAERTKQIAEMEAKYEKVKAQKENELQKQQLLLQEQEIEAQLRIRNVFIAAFILFLLMAIGLLYNNSQRKKMNIILRKQQKDLQDQADTLTEFNEEIQSQKVVLEESNSLLQEKNIQITDSIKAAKSMQEGLLPSRKELLNSFQEVSNIYIPKDIVSGDIYWYKKIGKTTTIAVIDCTGHGVPGAFMSMKAYTLLEAVIHEFGNSDTANILNQMQNRLSETLDHSENLNEIGMDVVLCCIKEEKEECYKVQFVGAKRPLYYTQGGKLLKLKGDNLSIGIRSSSKSESVFTSQELSLSKGDILYLTTDGYVDASNSQRKKIGSTNFEDLLEVIKSKKLATQKEILTSTLNRHISDTALRDDITILAVKL